VHGCVDYREGSSVAGAEILSTTNDFVGDGKVADADAGPGAQRAQDWATTLLVVGMVPSHRASRASKASLNQLSHSARVLSKRAASRRRVSNLHLPTSSFLLMV
jgi:hypothetical protein